jgi:hypothetical protein
MNSRIRLLPLVAGLILVAGYHFGSAQQPPASSKPVFHPGLGDLMTAFVQPRHTKLGLAGNEQNWTYAAYELNELREAFDDIAEVVPKYRNISIPDTIAASIKEPLAALNQAIKTKDAKQFAAAYAQLTAGCNACHQSAEKGMIVIRVPTASAFPDQDFSPPKP